MHALCWRYSWLWRHIHKPTKRYKFDALTGEYKTRMTPPALLRQWQWATPSYGMRLSQREGSAHAVGRCATKTLACCHTSLCVSALHDWLGRVMAVEGVFLHVSWWCRPRHHQNSHMLPDPSLPFCSSRLAEEGDSGGGGIFACQREHGRKLPKVPPIMHKGEIPHWKSEIIRNHASDSRYELCCFCFGSVLCLRTIYNTATMNSSRAKKEVAAIRANNAAT